MGCSALTFGLEPNLEGEHECLFVCCVMECVCDVGCTRSEARR